MSKTDPKIEITQEAFFVKAKPNAKETKISDYDKKTNTYTIQVSSPPFENKANEELLKFIKKTTGRHAKILTGLASKKKLIKLV